MPLFRSLLPFASVLAAATCAPALAQGSPQAPQALLSGTDGRWLARACASAQPGDRSFCYGYVLGLADQLALNSSVCRPATASGEQIVTLVRSHLAASPGDLGRHATFLVGRVLVANYPCRR